MSVSRSLLRALAVLALAVSACGHAVADLTVNHSIDGGSTFLRDAQVVNYTPGIKIPLTVELDSTAPLPADSAPFYELTLPDGFVPIFDPLTANCCNDECPAFQVVTKANFNYYRFNYPATMTLPACFTVIVDVPCTFLGQFQSGITGRFQVGQLQAATAQALKFKAGTIPPTISFDEGPTKTINCGDPPFVALDGVRVFDSCNFDITAASLPHITVSGDTVDPFTPNASGYTIVYSLDDGSGVPVIAQRSVVVTNNCFSFTQAPSGPGVITPSTCTSTSYVNPYYYRPGQTIRLALSPAAAISQALPTSYTLTLPDGALITNLASLRALPFIDKVTQTGLAAEFKFKPEVPGNFTIELTIPVGSRPDAVLEGVLQGDAASNVQQMNTTLRVDTTPPVISFNGGSVLRKDCGENFDYLSGVSATDDVDGLITACVVHTGVVNSGAGAYTLTYTVRDSSGNATTVNRTVVIKGICTGGAPNPCEGIDPALDTDGDGLKDYDECVNGTSPNSPDTDADGIDDLFEVNHPGDAQHTGLNPFRNDANEDADGDGLTNLQEYQRGSDPTNPDDPQSTFVVSVLANHDPAIPDDGSREHPFATIQAGIDAAQAALENNVPRRVIVLGGRYFENVRMASFVNVSGEPLPASGGNVPPVIEGAVLGADHASLSSLTIDGAGKAAILLDARGAGDGGIDMAISNVAFRNGGTGVLTDGLRGGETTIESCNFQFVQIGAEIRGAIPVLRRSQFSNISAPAGVRATGIYIKATTLTLPADSGLGETTDPAVGFNQFNIDLIAGPAIINERANTLKMENNDWKSNDATAIADAIQGPADFQPFLASGSSILAGAIFCTVIDNATQQRVTGAAINLTVSSYSPVTENTDGVYAFPAVQDGSYSVTTSATGYADVTAPVFVSAGQIVGVVVTLGKPASTGGGCIGGQQTAKLRDQAGDLMVAGIALAGMVAVGRLTRRYR